MTNNQTKCDIIYEKVTMRAVDDERMINYEWPKEQNVEITKGSVGWITLHHLRRHTFENEFNFRLIQNIFVSATLPGAETLRYPPFHEICFFRRVL